MNIDERTRHALHERLDVVLGQEEAVTLMAHLPPVGWADVATKGDIDNLAAATKRDTDNLAAATKRDIDNLAAATKRDLDVLGNQFRAELHIEIGSVHKEIGSVHKEIGSVRGEMSKQTRTFVFSLMGSNATLAALAFAAARLV